jgi:hypothetical protein
MNPSIGEETQAYLVRAGRKEVEQGNHGALELSATTSVDGSGAEGLPDDGLANVGSDEQGDTRAQTVALLEQLVEEQDNDTGNDELNRMLSRTGS